MNTQQLDQLARMAQQRQEQPMQLAQPLAADAVIALIAAQQPMDPEKAVEWAIEILARSALAVTDGAIHRKCQELANAPRLIETD